MGLAIQNDWQGGPIKLSITMAFGVFIHRRDSVYDDVPYKHYQFPKQYLSRAQQCEGDWIVYLEPRKVNFSKGYFAVAKVQTIISDPNNEGMYLAIIEAGTYLDFGDPVSFRDKSGRVVERGLLNEKGQISGRAQSAVRPVSTADFVRIVERGLGDFTPREEQQDSDGVSDKPLSFHHLSERAYVSRLTNRAVRDQNFRRNVVKAYGERCAVTGLRLINGGGRAEVEAAHIRPVKCNGPDIIGNGVALSGTAHWMFDRGLLGLADDLTILVSRHTNDLDAVHGMINETGQLIMPQRTSERPRIEFVSWHRENCFKT